jgi:leucyl-tRNA synthetase
MIHSGEFSGTPGDAPKRGDRLAGRAQGKGKAAVNYRLRDWLISRQRYWGAPIPMVYCPSSAAGAAVPDDQLPVLLPDDVEWKPTGESPLKLHPTWKSTDLPAVRRRRPSAKPTRWTPSCARRGITCAT